FRHRARDRLAPRTCPFGLARKQLGLLVDEEALGVDDRAEAVLAQATLDAARRAPREERRRVEPRVERCRGGAVDAADRVEPLAQPGAFGVGVDLEVLVLLRGLE